MTDSEIEEQLNELTICLNRVSIRHPPFPIKVSIRGPYLLIQTSVKDRETGYGLALDFTFNIPLPIREDLFLEFVESRTRAVFLHEFHECFHIDSRRTFDPHRNGSRSFNVADGDFERPFDTEIANHL